MGKVVKAADKGVKGFERIFIEDPRRAWTIGIFLVIVIVLIVVFWGKIKNFFEQIVNKSALNNELNDHIQETGESLTMSNATFNMLANKLYTAMKGPGTDEDTVFSVFGQLSNTADMLKLVAVFGTRDGETLDQWIRGDLGYFDLQKLNRLLSNKGIAYSF